MQGLQGGGMDVGGVTLVTKLLVHALHQGERRMVLEPDGEQGWRLRSAAVDAAVEAQP